MSTPPPKSNFQSRFRRLFGTLERTLFKRSPRQSKSNPGYEALKTFLRLIERTSDVFPPVKSAAAGLLGVCDIIESTSQNQQDLDKLNQRLEAVVSIINGHIPPKQDTCSGAFIRRLEGLTSALNHQISVIKAKEGRGYVHRLAESGNDTSDIEVAYQTLSNLLQAFTVDTTLSIEENTQQLLSHTSLVLLDKLFPVSGAAYDAFSPTKRHGCTEKTRVSILARLVSWATDPTATKIYWLNGMAGTGKTTISYSFSEILDKNQMLGASFFCSRSDATTGSVNRIFPTIAYQLAFRFPSVYQSLLTIIERDPGIAAKSLPIQFRDIIVGPLRAASTDIAGKYVVITIEALDECSDQDEVNQLLEVISQYSSTLPVKFFVTSRPEKHIRWSFNSKKLEVYSKFILHDVEKDIVRADIELFTRGQLVEIAEGRSDLGRCDGWPPERELKILVELAGNLFIYAATACAYVAGGGDIHKRLSFVTDTSKISSGKATATLDALYDSIINAAFEDVDVDEQADIKLILRAVANVQKPLSINSLSALFAVPNRRIHSALCSLHSVIHIPSSGSMNDPISTLHASFPEFITTPSRAGTNFLERSESQRVLAFHCLALMDSALVENILQLDGQRLNSEIPPDLIKERISDELAYACTYWAFHVAEMSVDDFGAQDFQNRLFHFFDHNVLKWVECCSVIKQLGTIIDFLRRLERRVQPYRFLWDAVMDIRRMITETFEVVNKYNIETYRSALVWLPEESRMRKRYHDKCPWKLIVGRRTRWIACEAVLIAHKDDVNSVAFSLDGLRIVSGSNDGTIRIWNATTGECEAELVGHIQRVWSVAISTDGRHIASGSSDGTVRIWNSVTGECEVKLENLVGVKSVSFSSDGSCILLGSDDGTIRSWNATTGKCDIKMVGHSKKIWSVAFSADGSFVVSGSEDRTIRIWKANTGECEAEMTGHTDTVRSVSFFPDGSHVVSGSEDACIGIWAVADAECKAMLRGHKCGINSVTVTSSANKCYIVSGSDDKSVRIWNAETRDCEAILEGHSGIVWSVAISSDGSRVISGSSDHSIRIWNSVAMADLETNQAGHTDIVQSVSVSPDGRYIASGSKDRTIRVWSVATRAREITLVGHLGKVNSLAFSPDGKRLSSGSDDNTARIWNIATGETEFELLGHTGALRAVAFSPDGIRVASGSSDSSVRVWNVITGDHENTLEGHRGLVCSVAFSPDSSTIVSGSDDRTVRLWNTKTGLYTVLKGHLHFVRFVAFYPDGDYVVSQSYDKTICVWNMKTYQMVAKLVRRDWRASNSAVTSDDNLLAQQIVLPDGNVVHYNSQAPVFEIKRSPPFLYCDSDYIRCRGIDQWCWIPPQFRNPATISHHLSKIILGYESGAFVVLKVSNTVFNSYSRID